MKKVTLKPTRMSCMSIAATLKGILMSTPGVESVTVRYEDEVFDVTYDETVVTPGEMIQVIGEERGIGVAVVE